MGPLLAFSFIDAQLPFQVEGVSLNFDPEIIPYIEAGRTAEVQVDDPEAGVMFRRRFPQFLHQSYKDRNVAELFGIKKFTLRIRYDDIHGAQYQTNCEIRYQPWKKQIRVGTIRRKLMPA